MVEVLLDGAIPCKWIEPLTNSRNKLRFTNIDSHRFSIITESLRSSDDADVGAFWVAVNNTPKTAAGIRWSSEYTKYKHDGRNSTYA